MEAPGDAVIHGLDLPGWRCLNILVSDKVKGTVTLSLMEMPWEQALDIILNSQGLVKSEKGGIIFIDPAVKA